MRTRKNALAALVVPVFRGWGRVLSGVGRLGVRPAFGDVLAKGRVLRGAVAKVEIALLRRSELWRPNDSECEGLCYEVKSFSFSGL